MKTYIEYKTKIAKECLLLAGMIGGICAVGVIAVSLL